MKMLIRTQMATLLICLLTAGVFAQDNPPKTVSAQSEAKKAFAKLKTLAGSWQGKVMDTSINFTIRAASSGTVILHEGNTSGGRPPNHEITMFYLDGDRLLATHYCDAGNRSRLEGKISADEKAIEFSFLDVAGSTRGGYLKDMVITMIDADHHIIAITFVMPDGKPIPWRGEFQRTGPTANRQSGNKRLLLSYSSQVDSISLRSYSESSQTGQRTERDYAAIKKEPHSIKQKTTKSTLAVTNCQGSF